MHVKATQHFFDDAGKVRPGQILDLTDHRGAELVRRGLVIDIQGGANKPRPTRSPPTNSQTGGEKQQSSSQVAPAPQMQKSDSQKTEQSSSRSTRRGNSRRSRTSSTPATERGGEQTAAFRNSAD